MGIPVDPEYGDDCVECGGILWPAGKTPKHIWVRFEDLEPCPGFDACVSGEFELTQLEDYPCGWEYDDGNAYVGYDALFTSVYAGLRDPKSFSYSSWNPLVDCGSVGENQHSCNEDPFCIEGTFSLSSYSLARHLCYGLHLCPHYGVRADYAKPSDHECVRLVSKRYSMNILVKYQAA